MLNVDRVGVGDAVGVGVDVGLAVGVVDGVLIGVILDEIPGISVTWGRDGGTGVALCTGVAGTTARVGVAVDDGLVA